MLTCKNIFFNLRKWPIGVHYFIFYSVLVVCVYGGVVFAIYCFFKSQIQKPEGGQLLAVHTPRKGR